VGTKTAEAAAGISLGELREVGKQVDAEFAGIFTGVFAQRRTWRKAVDYVDALAGCGTPVKTCWELAENAGYDTPGRFQSLIGENRWDHGEIWSRIAVAAGRLLPCPEDDPLGPGVAADETAQEKRGRRTVGAGVQWAGCVGGRTNCVTSVFLTYVTPAAATWIMHGLFMPKKDWFTGTGGTGDARRTAAGVPDDVAFETKPQIARRKFQELRDLGVHFTWAAGDEVYGRYAALRQDHEKNGEAYAYFVPRDFRLRTAAGTHRADELLKHAEGRYEIRSTGPGLNGPRYYEWAMIQTADPRRFLLIRRPLDEPGKPDRPTPGRHTKPTPSTGRKPNGQAAKKNPRKADPKIPDGTSFVYCHIPRESPIRPTMRNLVLMAGRRWPVEEANAVGKGPLGWDQNQYRTWTSVQHHTALTGIAMLKATAIRAHLENNTDPTAHTPHHRNDTPPEHHTTNTDTESNPPPATDDETIPLGDSPTPVHPDQPRPPDIGHIRLSLNETLRLITLANAGLPHAKTMFHLRWSTWRRKHQAIARWHHYRTRLAATITRHHPQQTNHSKTTPRHQHPQTATELKVTKSLLTVKSGL